VEAATLAVGYFPEGVAVTPDGKHAYVVNDGSNNVSVIDTATNTVEAATLAVGNDPRGVGIVPPSPGVPFLAFSAQLLLIDLDRKPNQDSFQLRSHFTLRSTASIDPVAEPVTLQIGTFTVTIPPGSFTKLPDGSFPFVGVIGGVPLVVLFKPNGTLRYGFFAKAKGASLAGTSNPVSVTLTIGDDSGTASITADVDH
jgi:YVTN family beta-propeller protein